MNTDINSKSDIRMTDVSVYGRSYEQVHGIGSRPVMEKMAQMAMETGEELVGDPVARRPKKAGRKYFDAYEQTDLDGGQKFYLCKKCGNLIGMLNDTGREVKCCDSDMERMVSVDMGQVRVHVDGNRVYVDFSKVPHTVGHDHHIGWAYIKTANGGQRQILYPDGKPEVEFVLNDDDVFRRAFVYSSHHGLWSAKAESLN